ncbi:MAG: hypothetical protein JWQ91_1541 [Aeromicrobium sp.]|uniref:putative bifunctional diguanylate cyclase/phosphodiesterase n=1 Tax=Aeromicrobium sp. TaxID=1871063 RepID=UPI002636EF5D|nr:bifunctional diguanylate cyclase/phosphodiesterase [Aeromicrobium sp.]MCW2824624.1 hypothetical protein [Aeromicrobium sp.]
MHQRYAVLGAVLVATYAVLPDGPARTTLYLIVGLSCVAAIVVGVRVNRPAARAPWLWMAAGQACWVAGDRLFDESTTSVVATSDLAYLAAYPLLAIGIADLIRRRDGGADLANLIDSAIVTVAAGLLSWVFVADPIVDDSSRSVAARAVAVAYPIGDVLLLAMLVALLTLPGVRSAPYRLLTVSIVLLLVADTVFAASPSTSYAGVLDLLWLTSYVTWGVAALHPKMSRISDAPHHRRPTFTNRRLAALVASALIAPALVLVQAVHGTHLDTWVVATGAGLLSLLVIGRMALNIDELRTTVRQRDELQSRLLHEASHDRLTGLLNAAAMHQLVGTALRRGQRDGTPVTFLLVCTDSFDDLVGRLGHVGGDELLRAVADRLQAGAPDPEQVARLDGELFAVCVDPGRPDDAAGVGARLMQAVAAPLTVAGHAVTPSVCVGAAVSMDGGTEPDDLVGQAHVALRRARAAGSGTFEVYGEALRHEMLERRSTEDALRAALADGGLELHYQPIVAVQSEIVDGYEARVHWRRPGHGWQDSDHFLAVAAASDLGCDIDRWVIGTAVRHLATWTALDRRRFADLTVAVQVNGRTLSSPGFVEAVGAVLRDEGVEPHRVTIGVSEMTLVDVPRATLDLAALRDIGVFVSINEFGTGRTSIGRMDSLPADIIKVDKSLVNSADPGRYDLLALLVRAAHSCGLLAVAEGVADTDRLAELRAMQYDSALGLHSSTIDPAESGVTVMQATGGHPHLRVVPDLP